MVQLGIKAKDRITGFTGIVVGYVTYITGCNQALLTPDVGEKGEHREPHWFDEQRIERVGDSLIVLENGNSPGCDLPAPKR